MAIMLRREDASRTRASMMTGGPIGADGVGATMVGTAVSSRFASSSVQALANRKRMAKARSSQRDRLTRASF
jgi:hypothetical protein